MLPSLHKSISSSLKRNPLLRLWQIRMSVRKLYYYKMNEWDPMARAASDATFFLTMPPFHLVRTISTTIHSLHCVGHPNAIQTFIFHHKKKIVFRWHFSFAEACSKSTARAHKAYNWKPGTARWKKRDFIGVIEGDWDARAFSSVEFDDIIAAANCLKCRYARIQHMGMPIRYGGHWFFSFMLLQRIGLVLQTIANVDCIIVDASLYVYIRLFDVCNTTMWSHYTHTYRHTCLTVCCLPPPSTRR